MKSNRPYKSVEEIIKEAKPMLIQNDYGFMELVKELGTTTPTLSKALKHPSLKPYLTKTKERKYSLKKSKESVKTFGELSREITKLEKKINIEIKGENAFFFADHDIHGLLLTLSSLTFIKLSGYSKEYYDQEKINDIIKRIQNIIKTTIKELEKINKHKSELLLQTLNHRLRHDYNYAMFGETFTPSNPT